LGFAEGVGGDDEVLLDFVEVVPNFLEDLILGFPIEHWQSEGAFGDEMVAFDGLERSGYAVGIKLIVARYYPDFAFVLQSYLSGAGYMSRGMKRNVYSVDVDGLSVRKGLKVDVGRESEFEDVFVPLGGEVVLVVVSGVVSVGVRDEGFVNGFMGVDEDIGGGAVETGGGGDR
jgi:hypothetical protein